jgi:hypothetical protein
MEYSSNGNIIICGDMNARTNVESDCISSDTDKHIPLHNDYIIDSSCSSRANQDKSPLNKRGRELTQLCVTSRLRIVNGRTFGDSGGKLTCHEYNGSSTVDYVIASEELIKTIPYFHVHNWMPLISDHCKLPFRLNIGRHISPINEELESHESKVLPYKIKWTNAFANNYKASFLQDNNLAELEQFNCNTYGAETVDKALDDLTNILLTTAKKAGNIIIRKTKVTRKKIKVPNWHNRDLWKLKKGLLTKATLMEKNPYDKSTLI